MELQLDILKDKLVLASRMQDIRALEDTVNEILNLQTQHETFLWEYKGNSDNFRKAWENEYKPFNELSEQAINDSYTQAQQQVNRTNQAIYDAIRAQGYVISVREGRMELVKELLEESERISENNTIGPVRLAQLGNHLAALQIEQLARMEYLMATNMRMQALIYAQQYQAMQKADISVNLDQFKNFPTENPLEDGPGDYSEMLSEK